jgi:outer membrane protein assembly factor BamB
VNPGDGEVVIGNVDLSAPGEAVAWTAAAVSGGPGCIDDTDGCTVFLDSSLGEDSRAFSSLGGDDIVAPGVTAVFDGTEDGTISVRTQTTEDLDTCGGLLDVVDGTLLWETCDYQVHQISPDGRYVAAPQTQYDGLGPTSLSVLDAADGDETGRYGVEGGFIGTWAWTTDGELLFDAYDGANWHLFSMAPDGGQITEIRKPVKGDEFSPYTLIQH